ERDAAPRERAADLDLDVHVGQVDPVDLLEERPAQRAAALHHAVADRLPGAREVLAAREHEDLVRAADVDQVREDLVEHEGEHGAHEQDAQHDASHAAPPFRLRPPAGAPSSLRVPTTSIPVTWSSSRSTALTVAGKLAT